MFHVGMICTDSYYTLLFDEVAFQICSICNSLIFQVVVVVGNSLSGQDISMELVDVAKEIHLSAKSLEISEGLAKVISKHDSLHLHLEVPLYHLPKF